MCGPSLKPFFTRMNDVLLMNQRQMMKKCTPKAPPYCKTRSFLCCHGFQHCWTLRVRSASFMARQLNQANDKACSGRIT